MFTAEAPLTGRVPGAMQGKCQHFRSAQSPGLAPEIVKTTPDSDPANDNRVPLSAQAGHYKKLRDRESCSLSLNDYIGRF